MRILGAVLAGGAARRFGSDKAGAVPDGETLIARVSAYLAASCDDVVVCGRTPGIADRPRAGLGPLGGVCAALHEGARRGADAVLTAPCDTPMLPADLLDLLSPAPAGAFLRRCPVIALWPVTLAPVLDDWLAEGNDRSMRAFALHVGAEPRDAPAIPNVNTPADLVALQAQART